MTKQHHITIIWIGFFIITLLFGFLTVAVFNHIKGEEIRLSENLAAPHVVSQPFVEHIKLRGALTNYMAQQTLVETTKKELMLRLDIYWSRIPLLVESNEAKVLLNLNGLQSSVRELIASIAKVEEKISLLTPHNKEGYFLIIAELDKQHIILKKIYLEGDLLLREASQNVLKRHKRLSILVISILCAGWLISSFIFAMFTIQFKSKSQLSDKLQSNIQSFEESVDKRTSKLQTVNKQLEILSIEDPLTKLFNRRYFDELIHSEVARSLRYKKHVSLLMCDIDYFKGFNDDFGHQQGDACLRQVADIIKNQCARESDAVVRYGGDEIAVILPETDLQHAILAAKNIGNAIWQAKIEVPKSNTYSRQTVSIGVAEMLDDGLKSVSELINCADENLYKAKGNGRNCFYSRDKGLSFPAPKLVGSSKTI